MNLGTSDLLLGDHLAGSHEQLSADSLLESV
jgi:hypothetical protein